MPAKGVGWHIQKGTSDHSDVVEGQPVLVPVVSYSAALSNLLEYDTNAKYTLWLRYETHRVFH